MKIVILDGYTSNPGDLSWDEICSLGECVIYDRTPIDQTVARVADADAVISNKTLLGRDVLARLPKLRYIGLFSTGTNVVDLAAAREQGVTLCNVPGYSTASVAQMVFALLLELTNNVGEHSRQVRQGEWSASQDFCYWRTPQVELAGLTLGIVGLGAIGRAVAAIAQAFGMRVVANTRTAPANPPAGVELLDLDELFRQSDAVTLHCPLVPQTAGMINAARLAIMKPSAFLINTGRGGLVVDRDLADALNAGRLAGAGLDVLTTEPPPADNPLLGANNCVITPHIAWATRAARKRLLHEVAENLRGFIAGRPRNVVS